MRINNHPILGEESEPEDITIIFEGKRLPAKSNEPIATVLMNAGIRDFRYTKKKHEPRGVYCAIGRCTDCMMTVNGRPNVRTCITHAEDGMVVERGKSY